MTIVGFSPFIGQKVTCWPTKWTFTQGSLLNTSRWVCGKTAECSKDKSSSRLNHTWLNFLLRQFEFQHIVDRCFFIRGQELSPPTENCKQKSMILLWFEPLDADWEELYCQSQFAKCRGKKIHGACSTCPLIWGYLQRGARNELIHCLFCRQN